MCFGRGHRVPLDRRSDAVGSSTTASIFRTHVFRSAPNSRNRAPGGPWELHRSAPDNGAATKGGWPNRRRFQAPQGHG
ncbi:hypothetical protein DRB96_09900 [Streptomyces sp. ICC1]|nr:hypothetical protein DRB89_01740 [Streptomyces sp. ICC4]AWZ12581.1 hypothetical protein DRB96_09900 [Streptomyces sp. ICC1]